MTQVSLTSLIVTVSFHPVQPSEFYPPVVLFSTSTLYPTGELGLF